MLVAADLTAIAGIVSGALVGTGGIVIGYLTARGERRHNAVMAETRRAHERRLALDDRIYDELLVAYQSILRFAYHMSQVMAAVFPFREAIGDIPEPYSQEDLLDLTSREAAIASPAVNDAMNDFFNEWEGFIGSFRDLTPAMPPDQANAIVQPHAQRFYDALERVRERISAELRGEEPAA